MGNKQLFFGIGVLYSLIGFAQADLSNCPQIDLGADNPIVAKMDKLYKVPYFKKHNQSYDTAHLNVYNYPKDSVPFPSEAELMKRLKALDNATPFSLSYNENVKAFIHLYAVRKRELTSRILGTAQMYFPMFEEMLAKHDLPLELKYLAVVESALNPTVKSRSGAVGLWQFMYPTGKIFDLNVTSYEDDRMDPYKSTEAACQYFKQLYKIYNNWELVLAAYNCGPGNVNKALRRSGYKKDYWELWPYLPKETRSYVPAFIAVNYVMNHTAEHNLYPIKPITTFFEYDTVHVEREISLEQIAYVLNISEEQLRFLNPSYTKGIIPPNGKLNTLYLPHDKVADFINNEQLVFETLLNPQDSLQETTDETEYIVQETRKIHTVTRGEYLGSIATKYNCSVNDIKSWNNMRSTKIFQGQKLSIYVSEKVAKKEDKKEPEKNKPTDTYVIQQGDTLWSIAASKGISVEKLKELNKSIDEKNLKAGMEIIIGG